MLSVAIVLVIINVFINQTLLNSYTQQKKVEVLANANIVLKGVEKMLYEKDSRLSRTLIANKIEEYGREMNSRVILTDEKNIVLGDSNGDLNGKSLRNDEIDRASLGETAISTYEFDSYGRLLYIAVPLKIEDEVKSIVFISASLRDIDERIDEIRNALGLISFISILFIASISFIFAGYFSKPIKEFSNAITKMAQGNLNQKVKINTKDEFQQLATAFNIMSTKIDQVDTQRKEFVANVSHELRTPLSSIKLLSGSLLHQDGVDENIYKEFLEDIDSEVDRLSNIISELLLLVDMDKEKITLNYRPTYLNHLVSKIITRLKPLADERNIDIEVKDYQKIQLKLDSDKIQQAVINILHNAIKYTPEGGKVEIRIYRQEGFAVLSIKDDGIGIPEESLNHIFERFYRVDKARARKTGGTGLGLAISHQIVSLHQGKIEVESKVDEGSTFYIKLPYYLDADLN